MSPARSRWVRTQLRRLLELLPDQLHLQPHILDLPHLLRDTLPLLLKLPPLMPYFFLLHVLVGLAFHFGDLVGDGLLLGQDVLLGALEDLPLGLDLLELIYDVGSACGP